MREFGYCVVVVDNGFVYVGDLIQDGGFYILTNVHNVRSSGTERGFGELAYHGPNKETKLDPAPPILVPEARMCHIMTTSPEPWGKTKVDKRGRGAEPTPPKV